MGDMFRDAIWALLSGAFNGFDDAVLGAEEVLTGGTFHTTAWNAVLQLSEALKPFCYIVITICLLIELAQVASKVDIIKWEHGLKIAVKMVFTKVCIDVAPSFLGACYLQASEWITDATSAGSYSRMSALLTSTVETQLNNITGFGNLLSLFATLMIVALAIRVCGLMVQVIAFGRMFELYVYLAVSPFPCAFFPLGDGSGGGYSRITMKFFRSFIAVCLQGVMIVLCIRIFNMIVGTTFVNMINNITGEPWAVVSELCYTMLMGTIVLIMSVSRCGSWAKGIIDAL